MLFRPFSRLRTNLQALAADIKGVAAVEFAYIAPLLILALFGTVEVSRGVMMHKRFQRVSAMIGDLVSREQTIGTAAGEAVGVINGMMLSANQVMAPFSIATLKLKVFSIRAGDTDATQTKSEWTYAYPEKTSAIQCSAKAMPSAGMLTTKSTAIVIEAKYTYKPLLSNLIPGFKSAMEWSDTISHSPRKASCVAYEGQNCGTICPAW
jgi:Flp pilus assembly pilin Flp